MASKKASGTLPPQQQVVHKVSFCPENSKKLNFFPKKLKKSIKLQVIMVGTGGVGKSALTLQFMYDEVRNLAKNEKKTIFSEKFRKKPKKSMFQEENTGNSDFSEESRRKSRNFCKFACKDSKNVVFLKFYVKNPKFCDVPEFYVEKSQFVPFLGRILCIFCQKPQKNSSFGYFTLESLKNSIFPEFYVKKSKNNPIFEFFSLKSSKNANFPEF